MCLGPLPEPKIDESNVTWFTFPPHDHDDISFDLEFKCSNVCRVVVKGMTWHGSQTFIIITSTYLRNDH